MNLDAQMIITEECVNFYGTQLYHSYSMALKSDICKFGVYGF